MPVRTRGPWSLAAQATSGGGRRRVLVTGATGYVGGRLLPVLERRADLAVRCLARRPEFLRPRVADGTEIAAGDVRDARALREALRGVDAAFYLVHSMGEGAAFEDEERHAARTFAEAARACGVRRIVYLGALGAGADLSPHLRSRQEVGEILRASGASTLELRASIVIGSGSLSFEIVRALTDRLPILVAPRWTRVLTQPIAIEDVVAYLGAALDLPGEASEVIEIGGADAVSYGDLMREYARQVGLRRLIVPVPVLTPRLSALWLALVTPVYRRIGRHLIEGLRNPTVVRDSRRPRPLPGRAAARRARGDRAGPAAGGRVDRRTRAGSTRSARAGQLGRGAAPASAGGWSTPAASTYRFRPRPPSSRSSGSGAATAGTPAASSGGCAARSTSSSAASACAAGGPIPRTCAPATRWTSGASRRSSPGGCCASPRR